MKVFFFLCWLLNVPVELLPPDWLLDIMGCAVVWTLAEGKEGALVFHTVD